jgi:hypothetical protein
MSTDIERNSHGAEADRDGEETDQARRDAVLRLAKYTAPAMLALLLSNKAAVAS